MKRAMPPACIVISQVRIGGRAATFYEPVVTVRPAVSDWSGFLVTQRIVAQLEIELSFAFRIRREDRNLRVDVSRGAVETETYGGVGVLIARVVRVVVRIIVSVVAILGVR